MVEKSNVKLQFTNIYKDIYFKNVIKKITLSKGLSNEELSYILNLSFVFYDWHIKTKEDYYFEFAYYLILHYSLLTKDFDPLYDFSLNCGFYPISKLIFDEYKYNINIFDIIYKTSLEKYQKNKRIDTKEQFQNRSLLLSSDSRYRAFIAPTSFGKSEFITEDIINLNMNKVGIIVPKKALIWETYRRNKFLAKNHNYKLLMHDTEYNNEERILGIFTQERALRLIQESKISFDILYIDEAHNLFEKDERNILLTRLIRLNKKINPLQKIVFLSPLINDSQNLSIEKNLSIEEQRISFNIKEPTIYLYETNNDEFLYNRFANDYIFKEKHKNNWKCYIQSRTLKKSLIYVYKPKDVQNLALLFSKSLPEINSESINQLIEIIKKYVDKDYYIIELVKRGVLFLHGKVPDLIRDFLVQKYKTLDEIKYLVSNSTVLEGVNFPIDSLFILNTWSLDLNNLNNLIGRVNRLNEIFIESKDLSRLLCPVYFIKTNEFGGNYSFRNKIELLRCIETKDYVENPILPNTKNIDINLLNKENEFLENHTSNELRTILVKNSIDSYYKDFSCSIKIIENNIKINNKNVEINNGNIFRVIYNIFMQSFESEDFKDDEIGRFVREKTINFYCGYFPHHFFSDLKSKISYFIKYFEYCSEKGIPLFIGKSFGEIPRSSDAYPNPKKNTYIDIRNKDKKERINIAIIKTKIEDDLISYKISRFVKTLLDLNIINQVVYDEFTYNTTNEYKIQLLKSGLSYNVINFIENYQLENDLIQTKNGFEVTEKFKEFLEKEDDYIKFEINKLIL